MTPVTLRFLFGTASFFAGGWIAWALTNFWYFSIHPVGLNMGWNPPISSMDMFLMRLCALSGAIAGLALSQFRYLPNDER